MHDMAMFYKVDWWEDGVNAIQSLVGKTRQYVLNDEFGAISTSYVVLTAAVVSMAAGVYTGVSPGLRHNIDSVVSTMSATGARISTSTSFGSGSSNASIKVGTKAAPNSASAVDAAIAAQIHFLGQDKFKSIRPDQMKYLKPSQLAAMTSALSFAQIPLNSVAMLNAAQIQAIPPLVLDKSTGKLSAQQIAWMTPAQINAVTGGGPIVNMVKKQPSVTPQLTVAQIATVKDPWWFGQLVKASGGKLSKNQIEAVTPAAMSSNAGNLSAQQIGWLTPKQINAVTGGGAIVNMVKKKPTILSDFSPAQIATVKDPWWFGQLVKASGGKLSKKQIEAVTPAAMSSNAGNLSAQQIGWLTPKQINAVTGGGAIVNMVKKQPALLSDISPQQIATVKDPWWFRQLLNASGNKLSKAQFQAVTPSAISTNALKLSDKQIGWLTPGQTQTVTGGGPIVKILKKRPELVSSITPSQLATIHDPWWYGQMPTPVLQQLTQEQVNGIPQKVFSDVHDRLNEAQKKWRD